MKTIKFFPLLLLIIAFTSCNTAKQYANYRFGGKSDREEKPFLKEGESEEITVSIPEKTNTDSIAAEISQAEETTTEVVSIQEKKATSVTQQQPDEEFSSKQESGKIALKTNERSPVVRSMKKKMNEKGDVLFSPMKNSKASDVFDAFIGILLVAILVFTAVTYLMSVNFAIADVILLALAIGLGILLCVGLGKLIMGMFPGMSEKKKNRSPVFLKKFHP